MNKTNTSFRLRLMILCYSIATLSFLGSCTADYPLNCDGEDGLLQEGFNNKSEEEILASLERGANPNASCGRHPLPLCRAAQSGFLKVVEVLLERGVPVDSKDEHGNTPLHWAAYNGHTAMAGLLIKRGVPVDSKAKGATPLIVAAREGHTAVAKLLLKRGAQVDSQDKYGFTPLHLAIRDPYRKGGIPLLKLLIDTPQDFHLKNNAGQTALAMAEGKFRQTAQANDAPGKKYYSLAIAMLKQKMKIRP